MTWSTLLNFMLGNVTRAPLGPATSTLGIILLIGALLDIGSAAGRRQAVAGVCKKLCAYFTFLVIAHRLDTLGVDKVLQWEGSTQYLVTIGLAVREGKPLLTRIGAWAGVLPPEPLTARMVQVGGQPADPAAGESVELDRKVEQLKQDLERLKELRTEGQEGISPWK